MVDFLRSLCIPSFCYYCHSYDDFQEPLCKTCSFFVPLLTVPLQIGRDDAVIVHALSLYEDPLKMLLNKRFSRDYLFWVKMGTLLHKNYQQYFKEGDLLIPIPDDMRSQRCCGFRKNYVMTYQVSLLSGTFLADVLSYATGKNRPFATTPEWYEHLMTTSKIQSLPPHKRCILIDSTLVTGATMATVCRKLRRHTQKPIEALILCRVNEPLLS